MNIEDLGIVVKRHVSGIMETDKGFKFPASSTSERGDYLVKQDGKKFFINADDYTKLFESKKQKYQKGVTKALRDEANSLGVEVFESTTKDELVFAIEEAKNLVEGASNDE